CERVPVAVAGAWRHWQGLSCCTVYSSLQLLTQLCTAGECLTSPYGTQWRTAPTPMETQKPYAESRSATREALLLEESLNSRQYPFMHTQQQSSIITVIVTLIVSREPLSQ